MVLLFVEKMHGEYKMKIPTVQILFRERQVGQCGNEISALHKSSLIFKKKTMHLRLLDSRSSDVSIRSS